MVQPGRPEITVRRMRVVCWITKATERHSDIFNTYCCTTATIVSRTRLSVTLYVHWLSCCKTHFFVVILSFHREYRKVWLLRSEKCVVWIILNHETCKVKSCDE